MNKISALGKERCPKCEGALLPNIAYDRCPHCNETFETTFVSSTLAKYQVIALGEMQQPGGVGATQSAGMVDGDPQSDLSREPGSDITDAGRNSFEENVALETWVNFAVDMLNRGQDPEQIIAQLAHDGCPDPEGVMKKAQTQPEDAPQPNQGAQDPFEIPYKQDAATSDSMESVSQQPAVMAKRARVAEWEKPWEESGDEDDDDDPTHGGDMCPACGGKMRDGKCREYDRAREADDSDKEKWSRVAADDVSPFEIEVPKTEPTEYAPKTKKTDPNWNLFDVDSGEGKPAGPFDVDETEDTDNAVEPIKFTDEVSKQETKDVRKSHRVKIASGQTGIVTEVYPGLWGDSIVKVALDGGGTIEVGPEQVSPVADTSKDRITEIQTFIDSMPPVEATRPSIQARVANLKSIQKLILAHISQVPYEDKVKLFRLDSKVKEDLMELNDNLQITGSNEDYEYLHKQPHYRVQTLDLPGIERPVVSNTEWNSRIAEHAAIFVSELPAEIKEDEGQFVSAAHHLAQSHNGNIGQFVAAALKLRGE